MIRLPQLSPFRFQFPPVSEALDEPNGLLAFGGDLRPSRLLAAYREGIFPWYDEPPILWWSPDPRAVIFPDAIHISRSLRKTLRRSDFNITLDRDFDAVVAGCSERTSTWITSDMQDAYREMHRLGHAHSIEVWQSGQLVGGLYGLAFGRMFFGESMFSRATDASKVALVYLCGQLQAWNFCVIDCQVGNDHTRSLGAKDITRAEFRQLLTLHIDGASGAGQSPWQLEWTWPERKA